MSTSRKLALRAAIALFALGTSLGGSGCYMSHTLDDGAVRRRDGSVPMDSSLPDGAIPDDGAIELDSGRDSGRDSGVDSGRDSGIDSGRDSGVIGRDAEPPIAGHPDPSRCRTGPSIFPFDTPALEYRWPNSGTTFSHPGAVHVCATPVVIDLTPSGDELEPVLVFTSYSDVEEGGVLRIVDPRTNTTITYPASGLDIPVLEASTNLAAGDIDGDGQNEIVGMGIRSGTFAFRADGTLMWESPYPSPADRRLGDRSSTIGGAISIADLEGDGVVEVIAGRNVLDGATGIRRWTGPDGTGRAINQFVGPISCVADLDGDGDQEVIAGRTAFRADGSVMWNNTTLFDGLCAVADVLSSSAGPEVVLVARGYVLVLQGTTGDVLWEHPLEGPGNAFLGPIGGAPTVADFDGDGRVEMGIAHGGLYTVYDIDCTSAAVPGCDGAGIRWTTPTTDTSSAATGSSVFDFNGDGAAEVVYNDEETFHVYDGNTGSTLFFQRNTSRTRTENPVIVDVDNDGDAEIVFSANADLEWPDRPPPTDPGVEVWGDARGRWVGARRIWNQHAYSITNVEEDGHIPSPQADHWTVLNAYRQNLREGSDVLVTPDLWGGRGTYECLGGRRIRFTINVQNWGLERVGAGIVVAFYRGDPALGDRIGEVATTMGLPPEGGSELVTFETTLTGDVIDYWAVLDDPLEPMGGAVAECSEGNNAVLIWRPFCR